MLYDLRPYLVVFVLPQYLRVTQREQRPTPLMQLDVTWMLLWFGSDTPA